MHRLGTATFLSFLLLVPACSGESGRVGDDDDDDDTCIDQDGDGFGENCPGGPDCDDTNADIGTECPDCNTDPFAAGCPCDAPEPQVCYTGPEGTLGVGVCRSGLRSCTDGTWSACEGEVTPTDEEHHGVNGEDDDCNGLEDDRLCGEEEICGDECCVEGEVCLGAYCGTPGECEDDGDCDNDTHCEPGKGCIPYLPGETDEDCVGEVIEPIPELAPDMQCEWTGGRVWVPPLVVDLDGALDDVWEPEIVFSVQGGYVVAIDGTDCEERWRTDGPSVHDWTPMALGDLEDDGHVELATKTTSNALVIFDDEGEVVCQSGGGGNSNAMPTQFANLDGVGDSEVMLGLRVYDSDCEEIWGDGENLSPWGNVPVVADVDLDGDLEVVTGNRIFDGATGDVEQNFGLANGLPAVADFDKSTDEPEIAVISPDGARIQTIEGDVLFESDALTSGFGGHWGGPPVVADFDGDDQVEFGAAGPRAYVVFDPDCTDDWARDGDCASGRDDGVLWEKTTQDGSSGATGSSVFDFDADGINEVVYGDECFTRIYDGVTGETRWITPNANGTAYEYPTIADMDGDGKTEIAIAGWGTFGSCSGADEETGELYVAQNPGVHVWRDVEDRWAPSRRMWNQHAYSVTNVNENGSIPAFPEYNWSVAGLNNFRVNTQDDPTATERGVDLTSRGRGWTEFCPDYIELRAVIANRGTKEAPRGLSIGFYIDAPPEAGGLLACETRTSDEIGPGSEEEISCDWQNPGRDTVDIYVKADNREVLQECEEDNNGAIIPEVRCPGID